MTNDEIIEGLKFTMDMCLFSPVDGSKRPISMLNDMDKITYNACEGAIKLLEQQRWIPVSDRLPKNNSFVLVTVQVGNREPKVRSGYYYKDGHFHIDNGDSWESSDKELIAWMPLPESYRESEDKE